MHHPHTRVFPQQPALAAVALSKDTCPTPVLWFRARAADTYSQFNRYVYVMPKGIDPFCNWVGQAELPGTQVGCGGVEMCEGAMHRHT